MHPNTRELRVLRELATEEAEPITVAGIGELTISGMIKKGWIKDAAPTLLGVPRYLLTASGEAVLRAGKAPKVRRPPRLRALPTRLGALPDRFSPPPKK